MEDLKVTLAEARLALGLPVVDEDGTVVDLPPRDLDYDARKGRTYHSLADTLMRGFDWSSTPNGSHFWAVVHDLVEYDDDNKDEDETAPEPVPYCREATVETASTAICDACGKPSSICSACGESSYQLLPDCVMCVDCLARLVEQARVVVAKAKAYVTWRGVDNICGESELANLVTSALDLDERLRGEKANADDDGMPC